MAEDLGEEWWETKNSKNDKIEDEGEFSLIFYVAQFI